MPIPKPREGEGRNDFVSRCVAHLGKIDPNRPQDQLVAMCEMQYRKKDSDEEILSLASLVLPAVYFSVGMPLALTGEP